MNLKALGLNCSLKSGDAESSTQTLLDLALEQLRARGCVTESQRVANLDIQPGVTSDEGPGDEWPALRRRVLESDILLLGTPIWLGQPSSIAKRVLERMDAFLGEADDSGRYPSFNTVAAVVVVGNEDGAHHVTAELYQALADVGFTIPAAASAYWVSETMGSVDCKDLQKTPEKVQATLGMLASNAVHLARLLKASPYPAP